MSLARAIATGDVAQLPSRRDEAWRWSDLRGLIRVLPPASGASDAELPPGPFDGLADFEIAIVNGRGPPAVDLAEGETRRVALRFVAAPGAGAHSACFAVNLGDGARCLLLESYEGRGDGYVASADIDIRLGRGATLERIVMADDTGEGVSVSKTAVSLGAEAVFGQTVLTAGARRQRIETQLDHPGAGAVARLDGLYLLGDKRHADITTVVSHCGAGGATDQLTKGVVRDQARGVFQGRIVVAKGADQTDARMGHHALVLSDRAEVDAKPELEIYADDVLCAHGNTVGALDEEALFYARQRGIPEAQARAMLMQAFLAQVIDRIEDAGARGAAADWLMRQLEARDEF
ncbi:MAG TPA: Fe-S cluster assembly protein SufD [Caulobacteraceae bacterium]